MRAAADNPLSMAWLVGRFFRPELAATFIVKGVFSLKHGTRAEPLKKGEHCCGDVPEESPRPGLRYASDFVPFKPNCDILLTGTCHAPHGKPVTVLPVAIQVGSWRKAIAVIGDRVYRPGLLGGSVSDPQPFTSIPLSWSRSLGGPGFEKNPVGRGLAEEEVPKLGKVRLMPNLDNPNAVLAAPTTRAEPFGVGPVDPNWSSRKSKAGTYDRKWLQTRWPWLPEDCEPSYFNAAPDDQQLRYFLKGDESLVLENLHPDLPRFETSLPAVRPRCFIEQEDNGTVKLREVSLVLDTLWLDADALKLVLVWRGIAPVRDLRMSDVKGVFGATEPLAEPPQPALIHRDRLVRWLDGDEEEEQEDTPEEESPPQEPSVSFDRDIASVNSLFAPEKAQLAAARQQGAQTMTSLGRSPAELDSMKVPTQAELMAEAKQAFESTKTLYPQLAHKLPPPSAPPTEQSKESPAEPELQDEPDWTRERVEAAMRQGFDFSDQDLSGLDLTGLDFSGGRFCFTQFSKAKLAGCSFAGADLRDGVFDEADLTAAIFDGAKLKDADFSRANLTGARFVGAKVAGIECDKCRMDGADLSGAEGRMASFHGSSLKGARFVGAVLPGADFDEAMVEHADFSKAMLDNASFEGARAKEATFAAATITKLHGAGDADFSGCDFKNCNGAAACFQTSNLGGADFTRAQLARADYSLARAGKTRFQESELSGACFADADLRSAVVTLANCCKASFERADLRGADLRQSNFFEAEFWDAQIDSALREGSNFKGTKLA